MTSTIITLCLLVTSAAYASVGLGGGTAYLAILSFWDTDPNLLRPLAWELNILCSVVTFYNYCRHGYFSFRSTWPYITGGIIGASLGAGIRIDPFAFQILLAATLLFASIRMFTQNSTQGRLHEDPPVHPPLIGTFLLSLLVGTFSGLVGIGGGIILGPIIISLNWVDIKHSAAITSAYIFLCSLAALITHEAVQSSLDLHQSMLFGATVLIGGYTGSRFGSGKATPNLLRIIFASITFIAAFNIIWGLFW